MVNSNEITVSSIWIYPIKSCRGSQVEVSNYTETGLDFDRQWMIVEEKTHKFLTARVIGRMVLIHPIINLETRTLSITIPAYQTNPASTHTIPLDIDPTSASAMESMDSDFHIWGSNHDGYSVGNDELRDALSAFVGKKVLLVQKGDSRREGGYDINWTETLNISLDYSEEGCAIKFNDAFPILLVSEASLAEVQNRINEDSRVSESTRWGKDLKGIEIERFRGNIVLKGAEEWDEDGWNEITIGEKNKMVVAARCARCMLPNVDPADGIRDKVVPDLILRPYRQNFPMMAEKVCFGVNAIPRSTSGIIRVGDKLIVNEYFEKHSNGVGFKRPEDVIEKKKAFSD